MYIPKNRIKPNQYTTGLEYIILSTGEDYTGYFYSLWNGKLFTGKNQNDGSPREIIPYEVTDGKGTDALPPGQTSVNVIALFLEDPDPLIDQDNDTWNQTDIVTYLELRGESPIDDQPRTMPYQSYPTPSEEDYQLGSFTRYFALKINEPKYLELNLENFKKIQKQDAEVVWELFLPFSIQWTLTGDEKTVAKTNRNQILIAERRIKKQGLNKFLRGNYLRFYKNITHNTENEEQTIANIDAENGEQTIINIDVQNYNKSIK
jgi:hypothetical protein